MKLFRKIATFGAACACAFALFGCAGADSEESAGEDSVATYADIDNMDFEYTERDKRDTYDEASATKIALAGDTATVEGDGVQVEGSTVTIDAEGTYLVSGKLANGQLRVNVADTEKVQVVLADASIHNETGAALFVEQADKCFITLAADSDNVLTDGADYTFAEGEDEPDAVLFSKDDLTINGTGKLTVTAQYKDAVASKDDLTITGGTFAITAAEDGLRGKDSLKISDGTFEIEAGGDALKSSRDDDPARGFVSIDGGRFTLRAGDDAIHGETYLRVTNGDINILTCEEGLEAMVVQVDGGDIAVAAQDDALNAAAPSASSSAAFDPASGDQGPGKAMSNDAESAQGVPDGQQTQESARTQESGSGDKPSAPQRPDQDGQRPSGQTQSSGERPDQMMEPPADLPSGTEKPGETEEGAEVKQTGKGQMTAPGGGMDEGNENCKIIINGGTLVLEAKGDAIDSNGSLEINGGTIYVTGPTSGGEGALDYALDASCNGGELVIVGSAGMAQDFSTSTQPSAFVQVKGAAGQEVSVIDQDGNTLLSYTPTAAFETVIVSSPQFVDGQEYSLVIGDVATKFTAATK